MLGVIYLGIWVSDDEQVINKKQDSNKSGFRAEEVEIVVLSAPLSTRRKISW